MTAHGPFIEILQDNRFIALNHTSSPPHVKPQHIFFLSQKVKSFGDDIHVARCFRPLNWTVQATWYHIFV